MNQSPSWLLAALMLALAGCAGQTVHDSAGLDARPEGRANVQARIHTELGAGYYARGQYAIALQELKIARESDPGYAPAYSILGLVHAELREDRQAEDNFRRAIDLSPGYSEGHNNYGLFLCQRGRVPESLARFEAASAGTPSSASFSSAMSGQNELSRPNFSSRRAAG